MRRAPALAACLGLAGCVAISSPTGRADPKAPELIGYWVPEGEDCESDAGVSYAADGTFGAYDISGTWRLEGRRLITDIRERGEPGEPVAKLDPPERDVSVILSVSKARLKTRWSDSSVHMLVRCFMEGVRQ